MDPMALPLSRFCHAVMAWLRRRFAETGDEEGWQRVRDYVYGAPSVVSAADEVEQRARAQVGDQAAAAAAFMGAGAR